MWTDSDNWDINRIVMMLAGKYEVDPEDAELHLNYGIDLTILDEEGLSGAVLSSHPHENRFMMLTRRSAQKYNILELKSIVLNQCDQELESYYRLSKDTYFVLEDSIRWVVVFDSTARRNQVFLWLRYLQRKAQLRYGNEDFDSRAMKLFYIHNTNNDDYLDADELRSIMRALNVSANDEILEAIDIVSPRRPLRISKDEFQQLMMLADCKPELEEVFYSHCDPHKVQAKISKYSRKVDPLMTQEEFTSFLRINQQTPLESHAQELKHLTWIQGQISFAEFCKYIFSKRNWVVDPAKLEVYQDMDQPLTSYFINSSHNTYLSGNQLTSRSMASRYVEDLYRGVRCIQIDAHDGISGPVIKHGYTITTPITFESVVREIAEFSKLNPNHFPVIVSVENHCNQANQQVMANVLRSVLAKKIFLIPEVCSNQDYLPSPNQLRGRVLLQGTGKIESWRPHFRRTIDFGTTANRVPTQQSFGKQTGTARVLYDKGAHFPVAISQQTSASDNLSLASLYSVVVAPRDILRSCYELANLSEGIALSSSALQRDKKQLIQFSKKSFIRVYPRGTRFLSSNFDPVSCWECGAQLVSLNAQYHDPALYVNISNFFENGGYMGGYVLKPESLRLQVASSQQMQELLILVVSVSNIMWNELEYELMGASVKVLIAFYGESLCDLGSSHDMQQNTNTQLRQVTEEQFSAKIHTVFKESQRVRYVIRDLQFAYVYFEVPMYGRVAIPVRLMRCGLRVLSLLQPDKKIKNNSYILAEFTLKQFRS